MIYDNVERTDLRQPSVETCGLTKGRPMSSSEVLMTEPMMMMTTMNR